MNPAMKLGKMVTQSRPGVRGADRFWYWVVDVLAFLQAWVLMRRIKRPAWRSFDGRVTLVQDMSDRHLHNTIRLLERTQQVGLPIYLFMVREAAHRRLPTCL